MSECMDRRRDKKRGGGALHVGKWPASGGLI